MSEGWHRAADGLVSTIRHYAAEDRATLYRGVREDPMEVWLDGESRQIQPQITIETIDRMLRKATPLWWSGEMTDMLSTLASSVPDFDMRESLLPEYDGFMWFDHPIDMPEVEDREWEALHLNRGDRRDIEALSDHRRRSTSKLRAMAWTLIEVIKSQRVDYQRLDLNGRMVTEPGDEVRRTILFTPIVEVEGAPRLASATTWTMGESLARIRSAVTPEAIAEDATVLWAERLYRLFGAAMLLMNQRIIHHRPEPLDRTTRRRIERELGRVLEVRVVQLRRQQTKYDERGDGQPIEWSCRWIVGGHWRSQEHLGAGREPIYILPYVKNADRTDLPLKMPPDQRVFEVVR